MDDGKTYTILVVEDDDLVFMAITRKLDNEGFRVMEANNGETAIKIALEKHPDLILLDIGLPKKNGLEVLEILRKDDWGKNVPIFIFTNFGFNSEGDRYQKVIDLKAEYLVKANTKLEDLLARIRKKLEPEKGIGS